MANTTNPPVGTTYTLVVAAGLGAGSVTNHGRQRVEMVMSSVAPSEDLKGHYLPKDDTYYFNAPGAEALYIRATQPDTVLALTVDA